MGRDWEKLAGETGRDVATSRFKRLMRVGTLGAQVTASSVARRAAQAILPNIKGGEDPAAQLFRSKQAQKVLKVLGEMKGATMKVGQILSSDPDLVPPEFVEALSELQRDAPPMTYLTVKRVIEEALDLPLESVFESFDPEPAGSASIGQVHRATLRTGEEVAVKVQYPGIIETLESDLRNLGSLIHIARVVADRERVTQYMDEVRSALEAEMDYLGEANRLARYHGIFEPMPGVSVPRPFLEFTRPNVLVMEFCHGRKLDEALVDMTHGPERSAIIERWIHLYSWMLHDLQELHADPHPGNWLLQESGDFAILDWGCVKRVDPRFADGVLDIMDACWEDDHERASRVYRDLGFGRKDAPEATFDPVLLREYHEIVLAPFLAGAAFDFGSWELRKEAQTFVLQNPVFLKLVPPAEGLLVFRVLGGIKGLLNKLSVTVDVHTMAVDVARRRGRLTTDPNDRPSPSDGPSPSDEPSPSD